VLLANGLAAESYLDTGDRMRFANGGKVITLHPELTVHFWEARGCARLCVTGPEIDAVRARLATRSSRGTSNAQRKTKA
jgi:collagen type I alpha